MELWDIYDDNRLKTGRTVERGNPMAPGEYHIVHQRLGQEFAW